MKRIIVLIILIVMLPVSSYGETFLSMDQLVTQAQEYDKCANGIKYNRLIVGQYTGYILGVYDATEWLYKEPPEGIKIGQMCSIVSNYIKLNPKDRDFLARDLIQKAFVNAFGINPKTQHIYQYMLDERIKLYNKP